MDEVGLQRVVTVGDVEKLPYRPMPVDDLHDRRYLVPLHELLDRADQHPEVAVVVHNHHFAVAVVPETQHDGDHHFLYHFLGDHHRAGHAQMVMGVSAIVEGR